MELASVIISGLAFVLAVVSWLDGRRRAASADRAALAAEAEARASTEAARRSAAALERQAALAVAAADRYEVPWELVRVGGDMWRLTNTNPVETAYGVTVEAVDQRQHLTDDAPSNLDIGPRGAVEFFGLSRFDDVANTDVRVRWRRTPDGPEERPWTHPTG